MFKKSDNPLVSLDIGKKVIIEKWLDEMGVKNYIINDDYSIDVDSNIYLRGCLYELPNFIKFNIINGYFDCAFNNLTSLEECPNIVKSSFNCEENKVKFTKKYVLNHCNVFSEILYL